MAADNNPGRTFQAETMSMRQGTEGGKIIGQKRHMRCFPSFTVTQFQLFKFSLTHPGLGTYEGERDLVACGRRPLNDND